MSQKQQKRMEECVCWDVAINGGNDTNVQTKIMTLPMIS